VNEESGDVVEKGRGRREAFVWEMHRRKDCHQATTTTVRQQGTASSWERGGDGRKQRKTQMVVLSQTAVDRDCRASVVVLTRCVSTERETKDEEKRCKIRTY
jgi:hypothetical protein